MVKRGLTWNSQGPAATLERAQGRETSSFLQLQEGARHHGKSSTRRIGIGLVDLTRFYHTEYGAARMKLTGSFWFS